MKCISYKTGYKYQLGEDYLVDISIQPDIDIEVPGYIALNSNGRISIKKSYAWDGPSGPTVDTLDFMRGSLVHDALYQFMRAEKLDRNIYKEPADRLLQKMCKEDGMSAIRAWWVYRGLRYGGDSATKPVNKKPVVQAPQTCQ